VCDCGVRSSVPDHASDHRIASQLPAPAQPMQLPESAIAQASRDDQQRDEKAPEDDGVGQHHRRRRVRSDRRALKVCVSLVRCQVAVGRSAAGWKLGNLERWETGGVGSRGGAVTVSRRIDEMRVSV